MTTKFIEAVEATQFNWGKFMVARFDPDEWARRSEIEGNLMLRGRGWSDKHFLVLDLQTGEGAIFYPNRHALASADLNEKHKVWVCPMFEPFLNWLYQQDLADLTKLPDTIDLGDVPTAMYGYRRTGK